MAHRGRLNVLINIVGKGYGELFEEFEGNIDPGTVQGSGDVKYHKGFQGKFTGRSGTHHRRGCSRPTRPTSRRWTRWSRGWPGPCRTSCRRKSDGSSGHPVLPLLIHGDAAFAGQGVVAETLNMSALPGYETGGTVHLVINNQLGFTTNPESARSSVYATDVAKMVQAPIFHVNGDDPEACVRVGRLAFAFRQRFHKDVVIDMVCYRRFGHNEQDDPSLTQPLLYQLIKEHRSVRKLYTEALVRRGDIDHRPGGGGAAGLLPAPAGRSGRDPGVRPASARLCCRRRRRRRRCCPRSRPGCRCRQLQRVVDALETFPEGFTRASEAGQGLRDPGQAVGGRGGRTGRSARPSPTAPCCSRATTSGCPARTPAGGLSATATPRWSTTTPGRFTSRSASLGPGRFSIYDSLLSEYAASASSTATRWSRPTRLVAWEAQFGDFVNGAQIVIDQFLAAAEIKWEPDSRGSPCCCRTATRAKGPSTPRLGWSGSSTCAPRTTCRWRTSPLRPSCSTFCAARSCATTRKPLVLFTPKRYLRGREAYSPVAELRDRALPRGSRRPACR